MMKHVSIILLALLAGLQQQQLQFVQANSAFNVGFLGGLDSGKQGGSGGFLTSTFGNTMDLAQGIPNLLNNAVQQVTKPLDGVVGNLLNPVNSAMSSLSGLTGGLTGQIGAGLSLNSVDGGASSSSGSGSGLGFSSPAVSSALNSLSLPTGLVGGVTTGLAAATGLNSVTNAATQASQVLTNPGRLGNVLAGTAGGLSSAARTAGAIQGAAQTAGAVSAASRAAGAMSAIDSPLGGAATGANLYNRAALAGSAMNNAAMMNGRSNMLGAVNSAAHTVGAMNAMNQMSTPQSGMNNLGRSAVDQLNSISNINNIAQYRNLQRREALASGTSGLVGNSIAAQSELMDGGAAAGAAAAASGLAAASTLGGSAGMEAAHLAGAAGAALESASGYGLGNSLGYNRLGLGVRAAEAAAGAVGAAGALGAMDGLGAMGGMGNMGPMTSDPVTGGRYLGGAGFGAGPYLGAIGHEAAATAAAANLGQNAINNHVAAGIAVSNELVPGAAHHSGMALNRAIAGDAIDSTARALGASRQLEAAAVPLATAANSAQLARSSGAIAAETALTEPLIENPLSPARQSLAADAHANAEAEAAIAGGDMVAHGLENSQSASLATNAYRQAKLASARDRVNIAGTVQNSARISDAAIATHDAATKAEDSLLGSELAVDSAATVLDSDAAYIPPVTNSMLRSLPYGRLGLRNILPKPLTYPSVLLPDVWLNGLPVNYKNQPFRMMPYAIGAEGLAAAQAGAVYGINRAGGASATGVAGQAGAAGLDALAAANSGLFLEGQPIISNNGIYLNNLLIDPKYAFLRNGAVDGSSVMPILANGQLEAQDEVAMANLLTAQQQLGPGMLGTYGGFARMNTVPMLTGSVSDANLAPTTTVGTTYPIGSALVVEPRDSYFQDYVDNASSRQNFDERQQ